MVTPLGVFSSRRLERATHDSLAFRYICANTHPDHSSIATFRQRFAKELKGCFTQILLIASAAGALKLGTVSLDGTKVKANSSKHKALSWEHANKLDAQLKAEVGELMRLGEEADNTPLPDGLDIPAELERREERLAKIAGAKQEIERRAKERHAREQAEYVRKWPNAPPKGHKRAATLVVNLPNHPRRRLSLLVGIRLI